MGELLKLLIEEIIEAFPRGKDPVPNAVIKIEKVEHPERYEKETDAFIEE